MNQTHAHASKLQIANESPNNKKKQKNIKKIKSPNKAHRCEFSQTFHTILRGYFKMGKRMKLPNDCYNVKSSLIIIKNNNNADLSLKVFLEKSLFSLETMIGTL